MSKCFVYLITSIFQLLGLAVLGAGLWLRFNDAQWERMQQLDNGETATYTYIGVGAALFLTSVLGMYGAGKPKRRISLFLFQLGTLACMVVSIYGSVILFDAVPEEDLSASQNQQINQTNTALNTVLTPEDRDAITNYQQPFAIFLAAVAGAEFLLFLCSIVLCCRKNKQPSDLPTYTSHHSPPRNPAHPAVTGQPVQFA